MSYINLNVYEEISARDIIEFTRDHFPVCYLMSDSDLLKYMSENICNLVLMYLDHLEIEHEDVEWGDGIDELWEECVDYLSD